MKIVEGPKKWFLLNRNRFHKIQNVYEKDPQMIFDSPYLSFLFNREEQQKEKKKFS